MSAIIVILSLLFGLNTIAADTAATVRGKVFDSVSGEPLVGANIIFNKSFGTITDEKGNYMFRANPGIIQVSVKFIGYKTETRSLNLLPADTLTFNIGLTREINEIDQIVVSANKTGQKISESTVSLSIIKPDILAKAHITDAEELINKTPGIEVLDGQASIRGGSGFSYGAGSRVLALIDGLPVLAADAGNIKWQFLPLENLSQVEIIKGAASVLYGSSALNGIINFRTAEASRQAVTKFYLETGFFDQPKQKSWIWWDSPRLFSAASFSHLKKYGNTDLGIGGGVLTDKGYRRLNDENLGRISLGVKHHDQKTEGLSYGFNVNAGSTVKRDFLLWEDATKGALKQDTSTALQLHGTFFALDPFIRLKRTDRILHDLKMRIQSSRNKFPDKKQNDSDALSFFTEYQLWYKIFEKLNVTVGVSENYSRINSAFYGNHEGFNLAGMTQFEMKPVKRVKLIAGLRFEFNSLDGVNDRLVPVFRTGVNYQASEFTFLRASFGQGYRYPSIAERHASTSLGTVIIYPNPFIKSESGWNSEIGIKQGIRIGNFKGQADIAAFYSQNKDLIEYIFGLYPDPVTGIYANGFRATNVEQSRVYGYEFEYLLNNSAGNFNTTISGGYIFMYPVEFNPLTKKNTDTYLKYRRKHSAKLSLSSAYRKIELGADLFVKSKLLNVDDVFLGAATRESIMPGFYDYWIENNRAYFVTDLNLGYQVSGKYSISLSVKNLTNTEYMGRPGDIRPQRSFGIRFSGVF